MFSEVEGCVSSYEVEVWRRCSELEGVCLVKWRGVSQFPQ